MNKNEFTIELNLSLPTIGPEEREELFSKIAEGIKGLLIKMREAVTENSLEELLTSKTPLLRSVGQRIQKELDLAKNPNTSLIKLDEEC